MEDLPRLLPGHDRKIGLTYGFNWRCGTPPLIDEPLEHTP
jgi:hypothetical protein